MLTNATEDPAIWLRARLDADEDIARRVDPNQAPTQLRAMVTRDGSPPFLVIDSARLLAQVDATRRILDLHQTRIADGRPYCDCMAPEGIIYGEWPCAEVRLLVMPHANEPGYREEWRP